MTIICDHNYRREGSVTSQYDICLHCGATVRPVDYISGIVATSGPVITPIDRQPPKWAPPPCAPKQRRKFSSIESATTSQNH